MHKEQHYGFQACRVGLWTRTERGGSTGRSILPAISAALSSRGTDSAVRRGIPAFLLLFLVRVSRVGSFGSEATRINQSQVV